MDGIEDGSKKKDEGRREVAVQRYLEAGGAMNQTR